MSVGEDKGKLDLFTSLVGMENGVATLEIVCQVLKSLNIEWSI